MVEAFPGLDLDEGEHAPAPGDDIDLAQTALHAPGEDAVAAQGEADDGEGLPRPSAAPGRLPARLAPARPISAWPIPDRHRRPLAGGQVPAPGHRHGAAPPPCAPPLPPRHRAGSWSAGPRPGPHRWPRRPPAARLPAAR